MKIGIMSMQRINNYGSFLQAYGLKKIVESLGHDVSFVDYEFEKSIVVSKRKSIFEKIITNINAFEYIKKKKVVKEYSNRFENEFIPYLCGKEYNIRPKDIDELIIGSDEVFNCLQDYPVGYSRELFGKNYEKIPVISYAACFGQTTYNRLNEYKIDKEVGKMLSKFKAISVRDENSFNTVLKLTNKKPSINLDPVLMYDFKNEMIDNVNIKDYIIIYAYPNRFTKDERKIIKQFAKQNNKKIISMGMYQKISDKEIVVNPFEIFAYFKHADYIITDTFHGSIFSMKTHSKFCTIIRDNKSGNSNKLLDLLKRTGFESNIVNSLDNIGILNKMFNSETDFSSFDSFIEKERKKTIKYLSDNIK